MSLRTLNHVVGSSRIRDGIISGFPTSLLGKNDRGCYSDTRLLESVVAFEAIYNIKSHNII